ncbi:MAG: hypothetical protein HY782_19925 [Chloroflexi bacterium]|nr:hypothetical protein [Chloroflexota bacterium]
MNNGTCKQAYLPALEGIVEILSRQDTFTYKQVLPLLLDRGLSSQVVWRVMRRHLQWRLRYLEIVERRTRQQGHVYRAQKRGDAHATVLYL